MLVTMSFPAYPQSQPQPPRGQDGPTITPNYKDADLSQIIQAVSEVTGKNFIIDPRVNAKVTMLVGDPDVAGRVLRGLLGGAAGLRLRGPYRAGKVIKIIPEHGCAAAALHRPAERSQLDLGRNRHPDHHNEERERGAARPAAAPR